MWKFLYDVVVTALIAVGVISAQPTQNIPLPTVPPIQAAPNHPKKLLGGANPPLVEVPRFYEDKNDRVCFMINTDGTEGKEILKSDYKNTAPGYMKGCRNKVKQTILQDNQYYKLDNGGSSTPPTVFEKLPNQMPSTTTLQ